MVWDYSRGAPHSVLLMKRLFAFGSCYIVDQGDRAHGRAPMANIDPWQKANEYQKALRRFAHPTRAHPTSGQFVTPREFGQYRYQSWLLK
jgi:hypothetical protein